MRELSLQLFRHPDIIGIEERQDRSTGLFGSEVPAGRDHTLIIELEHS
jgi:hypothetical protein